MTPLEISVSVDTGGERSITVSAPQGYIRLDPESAAALASELRRVS